MNPATIAMISAAIGEALRLALHGATLIEKGNKGELTDEEVKAQWAQMNTTYGSARKAWDDA